MPAHPIFAPPVPRAPSKIAAPAKTRRAWGPSFVFPARPRSCEALKSPGNATGIAMTNLHRSPPMNQSETDLGIVNESQLLGFGIIRFRGRLSDHRLAHDAAAVHLVFEIDHRRPRKMPGQARTGGAAADQLVGHDWMEVMHGIGLHRRDVFPTKPERAETAFHFVHPEPDIFLDPFRAEVAVAHDTLGIAAAAATQFGAAGDHECRRCALARAREGEGVK